MWGIAYGHTSQGHVWPKSHPQIKAVMAGICNCMTAARTQKTPIGVGVLAAMAQGASTRDRALLLLGWHGAFRRAELAALNAEDVTFTAEGAVVRIRRSKTDQEGRGADVGIPHASNKPVCAVAALKAHLHGRKTGPLFATHCSKRMSANSIAERVKVAAARVGLNPKLFAGHSLRSGFATTAAEANKPIDAIMRQGRWQNVQTVMEYIRPATLFTSNAAQGLTDAKEKTP
jgi:integrase